MNSVSPSLLFIFMVKSSITLLTISTYKKLIKMMLVDEKNSNYNK